LATPSYELTVKTRTGSSSRNEKQQQRKMK